MLTAKTKGISIYLHVHVDIRTFFALITTVLTARCSNTGKKLPSKEGTWNPPHICQTILGFGGVIIQYLLLIEKKVEYCPSVSRSKKK